ncbi:MAG: 4Fe-4S binding protein [Candidatus Marinimicrobia bacterium]|nr:4Fe-4S binding protein [Candidatus Neomarinimicrobiota bacterium]
MLKVDNQRCDLCGLCVSVCPVNALEMFEKYVEVDQGKCTACTKCTRICPVRALSLNEERGQDA